MHIGYHSSHEQFRPSELLDLVIAAERVGFQSAMCSDHFAPWSARQGESGFAWSWLGAAMQSTAISFGTVTSPVGRYHPVLVAQAAATLAEMFPSRFWVALGTGLAANESFMGRGWPPKETRKAIVEQAAPVIRRLWAGETVTHVGAFKAHNAVLYTRPSRPPLLVGAAISESTARWVGSWADAMITILQDDEEMAATIGAFREGGGGGKPVFLQAQHSYAATDEEATANAHDQWAVNIFESSILADLRTPAAFDAAGKFVRPEDLKGHIRMSSDPDRHVAWLRSYADLGFDRVFVHNVGRNQREFIDVYGREVIPAMKVELSRQGPT
jgi:coenzyme F420-dependent glucose-6-phosphate dehydrogenase